MRSRGFVVVRLVVGFRGGGRGGYWLFFFKCVGLEEVAFLENTTGFG